MLETNKKVAVQHVRRAIFPAKLRSHLDSNLAFSHADLKKDIKQLLELLHDIAEAFSLVDNGAFHEGNGKGSGIAH